MMIMPGSIYAFMMLTGVCCLVVNSNKCTEYFPFNSEHWYLMWRYLLCFLFPNFLSSISAVSPLLICQLLSLYIVTWQNGTNHLSWDDVHRLIFLWHVVNLFILCHMPVLWCVSGWGYSSWFILCALYSFLHVSLQYSATHVCHWCVCIYTFVLFSHFGHSVSLLISHVCSRNCIALS